MNAERVKQLLSEGSSRFWRAEASVGGGRPGHAGLQIATVWRTHCWRDGEDGRYRNALLTLGEEVQLAALLRERETAASAHVWVTEVAGARSHPAFDFDGADATGTFVHAQHGPTAGTVEALVRAADAVARRWGEGAVERRAAHCSAHVCATVTRKVGLDGTTPVPHKFHVYLPAYRAPPNFSAAALEQLRRDLTASLGAEAAERFARVCDVAHAGDGEHKLALIGSCKPDGFHVPHRAWILRGTRREPTAVHAANDDDSEPVFEGFRPEDDPLGQLYAAGVSAEPNAACAFPSAASCERFDCPVHAAAQSGSALPPPPPLLAFALHGEQDARALRRAWWSLWYLRPTSELRADAHALVPCATDSREQLLRAAGARPAPRELLPPARDAAAAPATAADECLAAVRLAVQHAARDAFPDVQSAPATFSCFPDREQRHCTLVVRFAGGGDAQRGCPPCGGGTDHAATWTVTLRTKQFADRQTIAARCPRRSHPARVGYLDASAIAIAKQYVEAARLLFGQSWTTLAHAAGAPGPVRATPPQLDPLLALATTAPHDAQAVTKFARAVGFPHAVADHAQVADSAWAAAPSAFAVAAALRASAGSGECAFRTLLRRVYGSDAEVARRRLPTFAALCARAEERGLDLARAK